MAQWSVGFRGGSAVRLGAGICPGDAVRLGSPPGRRGHVSIPGLELGCFEDAVEGGQGVVEHDPGVVGVADAGAVQAQFDRFLGHVPVREEPGGEVAGDGADHDRQLGPVDQVPGGSVDAGGRQVVAQAGRVALVQDGLGAGLGGDLHPGEVGEGAHQVPARPLIAESSPTPKVVTTAPRRRPTRA